MRAPLCSPVLALALLAATPPAAQEPPSGATAMRGYATFYSMTCTFGEVEGAQPARTVTIQRGDDAEFEWKGEAEPN